MTEGYQPERTPRVTPALRLLLSRIEFHSRLEPWCRCSIQTLADEAGGLDRRHARRLLADAVGAELVEVERRPGRPNRYRLTDAARRLSTRGLNDRGRRTPAVAEQPRSSSPPEGESGERERRAANELLGLEPLFSPSTVPSSPRATPARPREAPQVQAVRRELRRLYFDGGSAGLINVWVGKAAQAILAMTPDATPELVAERSVEARRRFGDHRVEKLAEHWPTLGRPQQVGAPRPTNTARGRASADIARLHAIADELRARGPLDGHLLPPGGNA